MEKIPIGIIGVGGYTGLELVKIVLKHAIFEIKYLANTTGSENLYDIHPSLASVAPNLSVETFSVDSVRDLKLVFLALPHEQSMRFVPEILALGVKIVDLSADYRLSEGNYNKTYTKHTDSANLAHAAYGLIEWNRAHIANATLIANPGCYPTASLLGILPFARHIKGDSIFIDAKSGVSGAGKKLTDSTHFPTINENMFSYAPLSHRHQIEIAEKCAVFGGRDLRVNFIPHLSPFTRGMLVSVFAHLTDSINPLDILRETYANEPFIRVKDNPVDVKSVCGTHFCDIFATRNDKDIFISVSIDNLLRGASSQAVACANLMCGLEETLGLPRIAYVP